jgi:hypothetical protein
MKNEMDGSYSTQTAIRNDSVNTVMNLQVAQKGGLASRVTISFSGKTLLHGVRYYSHRSNLHSAEQRIAPVTVCTHQ